MHGAGARARTGDSHGCDGSVEVDMVLLKTNRPSRSTNGLFRELETPKAKAAETAATVQAAAAEDRDRLKQRIDQAQDAANQAMHDAKQQAEQAADRAGSNGRK
jgi:hypothetical protein